MITKMLKLAIVIAIVFANTAFAQTISGKIIDNSSKQPLAGASIKVVGSPEGTILQMKMETLL